MLRPKQVLRFSGKPAIVGSPTKEEPLYLKNENQTLFSGPSDHFCSVKLGDHAENPSSAMPTENRFNLWKTLNQPGVATVICFGSEAEMTEIANHLNNHPWHCGSHFVAMPDKEEPPASSLQA